MDLRRQGADANREGWQWSLPLGGPGPPRRGVLAHEPDDAADRIVGHLGSMLALQPRKRFAKDTVLIVYGTLVPPGSHCGRAVEELSVLHKPPGRH